VLLRVAAAGSKDIAVGTAVALIVEEEGDLAAFKDYTPGGEQSSC
jgi:pyruvate dehydrogenase E2 component (dihydrolipoamide acetyltransferase)